MQIVLVNLLHTPGVEFAAVVGHSSGEIAAAYAAGFLSATDAVRVAYYRGFHAHLAGNKAKAIFDEEKRFARLLKVDTAYHSHHMLPCGDAYLASIRVAGVTVGPGNPACAWYSSVIPGQSAPM